MAHKRVKKTIVVVFFIAVHPLAAMHKALKQYAVGTIVVSCGAVAGGYGQGMREAARLSDVDQECAVWARTCLEKRGVSDVYTIPFKKGERWGCCYGVCIECPLEAQDWHDVPEDARERLYAQTQLARHVHQYRNKDHIAQCLLGGALLMVYALPITQAKVPRMTMYGSCAYAGAAAGSVYGGIALLRRYQVEQADRFAYATAPTQRTLEVEWQHWSWKAEFFQSRFIMHSQLHPLFRLGNVVPVKNTISILSGMYSDIDKQLVDEQDPAMQYRLRKKQEILLRLAFFCSYPGERFYQDRADLVMEYWQGDSACAGE